MPRTKGSGLRCENKVSIVNQTEGCKSVCAQHRQDYHNKRTSGNFGGSWCNVCSRSRSFFDAFVWFRIKNKNEGKENNCAYLGKTTNFLVAMNPKQANTVKEIRSNKFHVVHGNWLIRCRDQGKLVAWLV